MFPPSSDVACRIVLPTYNRRHVLEHTIPHYLALGTPLLVVDDGSTDGTTSWLRSLGIAVIRHPHRRGLPAARNTGLRLAASTWVLFGEDDVLFAPEYVEVLMGLVKRLPQCGAVAGLLFTGHDWQLPMQRPEWEGDCCLDSQLLLANFAAAQRGSRFLPTIHACALVDRAAVLAVGGYDESMRDSSFREESDCYARLWRSGRSVWLTADTWAIHVRHRLGGGCRGRNGLIAKLVNRTSYLRNNSRFVDRHWRFWRRWIVVPQPGRLKWNFFCRLVSQQLAALCR